MDQRLTSVKYIGKRPEYTDGTYGTRIHFVQGESRMVPFDIARKMLKHLDVYAPGEVDAPVASLPPEKDPEDDVQDMRDSIAIMDKDALSSYAQIHFGTKLDKRKDVGQLRSQVTSLVDQYGSV
jgi:hypothetical protein